MRRCSFSRCVGSFLVVAGGFVLAIGPLFAQGNGPGVTPTPTPAPTAAVVTPATVTPARPTAVIDAILVTVNDELVLVSDLRRSVLATSGGQTTLEPSGRLVGGSLTPEDGARILDQLINQKVLAVKVREQGLQMTDDELTIEINNTLKQQNVTMDQLLGELKSAGETLESYREEFKQQAETQRLIGRIIRPSVSVTEDDVRSYYLQQPGIAEKQQRVRLRSLVVQIPASLSEIQVREKREIVSKIEKEVKEGTAAGNLDFERLVKVYSNDPEAMKGGELAPKTLSELPAAVRKEMNSQLKEGTVIGPVTIGTSIFFFQYLGTSLGNSAEFEKQKEHWKNMLLEAKGNERLMEYLKAERTKMKIDQREFKFSR